MLSLTKEVTKDDYEGGTYQGRESTVFGKVVFSIAGIAALYGVFSDKYLDVLGDRNTAKAIPEDVRREEASVVADQQYKRTFQSASPAGKFALQYLTTTNVVRSVRNSEPNNGSGPLGFLTGTVLNDTDYIQVSFGDGCLNKTAYDINGGDITGLIRGAFVSGEIQGDIPTAAANPYVDSNTPDVLTIQSGHANSRDLRFKGVIEGSGLTPADQQTEDVLQTFGCIANARSSSNVNKNTPSSPWIIP